MGNVSASCTTNVVRKAFLLAGKKKRFAGIVANLTEEAPKEYKTVAISRDGRGNYYASFPTEVKEAVWEEAETEEKPEVLAIDLGIKTLATGVNKQGRVYHSNGFHKGKQWYNRQLVVNWAKLGSPATLMKDELDRLGSF